MTATVANDLASSRLEKAGEWCMRLAEGVLQAGEQAEFDAWLADDENRAAFERTVRVWDSIGEIAAAPEAIHFRTEALEAYRAANEARWATKLRRPRHWVMGAAVAIALLLVPAGLWYRSLPDVYDTDIGEREVAVLDDGSRVTLDADTRLDVSIGNDRREIVLEKGRARFDVVRDQLRPFSVQVGDKQVVATGTSFSVESVNGQLRVILYEGQVAVVRPNADRGKVEQVRVAGNTATVEAALKPGMELVAPVLGQQAIVAPTSLERASSWEQGQLVFDDEPLALAVNRVNRYSARKVVLADAEAARQRVSGVYNAGDVDAFAVGVVAILPVRVTNSPTSVTISSK